VLKAYTPATPAVMGLGSTTVVLTKHPTMSFGMQIDEKGYVMALTPGGPAAVQGVKSGSRIVSVNRSPVGDKAGVVVQLQAAAVAAKQQQDSDGSELVEFELQPPEATVPPPESPDRSQTPSLPAIVGDRGSNDDDEDAAREAEARELMEIGARGSFQVGTAAVAADMGGVEVRKKGLEFEDGTLVRRKSPRLSRALRATGVLWGALQPKVLADFTMDHAIVVPHDTARLRLQAFESLRQANLRAVLVAREALAQGQGQGQGRGRGRAGAISAPPVLPGGAAAGRDQVVLTPAEMAQKRAEALIQASEEKRLAARAAASARLAEQDAEIRRKAELDQERAAESDRVQRQFEQRAR
jgi:hypothetical protein